MQLQYVKMPDWPPLAWIAACVPEKEIKVYHGNKVETHENWFCEAVWDGPFSEGNFHKTDIVFGSGGALEQNSILFVSSGTTVDRLQYAKDSFGKGWVSNSLVCLLKFLDMRPDPTYSRYYEKFKSIINGINSYDGILKSDKGNVYFLYFNNLLWNGKEFTVKNKPFVPIAFDSFGSYRSYLENKIQQVSNNIKSSERDHSLGIIGTMSSGYDSTTIAALASKYGLEEVISFESSRDGLEDSGREIAAGLGLRCHQYRQTEWKNEHFGEIPFIAGDAFGSEVFFKARRSCCKTKSCSPGLMEALYGTGRMTRSGRILFDWISRGCR